MQEELDGYAGGEASKFQRAGQEASLASLSEASMAKPPGQYKFLTFRMVRQGRVQLRDVRVQMQAQYWISGSTAFGDRDSHKGRVVNLQLEQNYFTTLEQLQVMQRQQHTIQQKQQHCPTLIIIQLISLHSHTGMAQARRAVSTL